VDAQKKQNEPQRRRNTAKTNAFIFSAHRGLTAHATPYLEVAPADLRPALQLAQELLVRSAVARKACCDIAWSTGSMRLLKRSPEFMRSPNP